MAPTAWKKKKQKARGGPAQLPAPILPSFITRPRSPSPSTRPPTPNQQATHPWRWRARWRHHRYVSQQAALGLPPIDWRRQNLQVLFVDRTGLVRARLAAALLEAMADWDGLGRAVAPSAAGLAVGPSPPPSLASTASLLTQAGRLGLRARIFTAPPTPFEPADLDAADLIIGVDAASTAGVLEAALAGAADPKAALAEYGPRIACLPAFAACRGPRPLFRSGSDVLPPALASLAAWPPPTCVGVEARAAAAAAAGPPRLSTAGPFTTADARACAVAGGFPRAALGGGQADWDAMTWHAVRGVAGLAQYLGDAMPPDMR